VPVVSATLVVLGVGALAAAVVVALYLSKQKRAPAAPRLGL